MASTTVPQSVATTPSAPTPAVSPEEFIVQYMKDTQVDPDHDKIPRAPNAFMIFKKYYNAPPTEAAEVWKSLSADERVRFFDAQDAARELHQEMYPDYKFKPQPRGGPSARLASNDSVITTPVTFTAPTPSVLPPAQSIQQDDHEHHYGYSDEMSAAFSGLNLENDLFSSYQVAEVAPYLFECLESNVLADLNNEINFATDFE